MFKCLHRCDPAEHVTGPRCSPETHLMKLLLTPDRTANGPIREQRRWTKALRSGPAPLTCGADFIGHIYVC